MDRKTVVIKKYENRRLYDTASSRYINLDEVAELVRGGADVQVLDATTGEDLTRVVLTQIIVDSAKEPGSAFPLDMLRQMVMASGRASQESMLKYMKSMFDMYQSAYRPFAAPMNPFDFFQTMGAARPSDTPQEAPASNPDPGVEELKRRVEELENLVSNAAKSTSKAAGRKSNSTRKR
jgi:polyhydroxyalkanoate synthesis repressor PhaR